ncbi:TA2R9 protein, partial [Mionectes macconnelli]|nr:TA2R9 protein [Mionectes macconnelli]
SPEQFNVTSYDATAVAIITFEALAGMWINAFIVSVIGMSWVKKKTLNSYEKILLLLGCSRFCFLCVSWVFSLLSIIYPNYLYAHLTLELFAFFQNFFSYSSLWFSACLYVFYCIKIANFRNSFFIYLKVKINRIVPWLLLGSVLLSLVIAIVIYDFSNEPHCNNSTGQVSFWKLKIQTDEQFFSVNFMTGFGYAVSFMAVTFSAILLLFSLWKHKCNMQTNSVKDLSMDAHIKAMKSIISFFVMYSINFVSLIAGMIYSTTEENLMMFLIYIFLYAFPSVHSLILIFSNPSLETTLLRILPCVKCKVCMK